MYILGNRIKMIDEEDLLKELHRFTVTCDECFKKFERSKRNVKSNRKKYNGKDICASCSAKKSIKFKPQCNKEYWTEEKRIMLGSSIKTSENYQKGIKKIPRFGTDNPMFGKKHSEETIKKMSISRTGKTGKNSTAWKGGKCSLNYRIKRRLYG